MELLRAPYDLVRSMQFVIQYTSDLLITFMHTNIHIRLFFGKRLPETIWKITILFIVRTTSTCQSGRGKAGFLIYKKHIAKGYLKTI